MDNMSGFVQLTLGREKFLIRQEEVVALEPAMDVHKSISSEGWTGTISRDGNDYPVYNLTSNLELSNTPPDSRGICVCLSYENIQFGIICDEVDNMTTSDFTYFMVPDCMQTESCPVKNLAVSGNKVTGIISLEAIFRFLPVYASTEPDLLDSVTSGQES